MDISLIIGFSSALILSALAVRFRALTPGGAAGATIVGTLVFAAGGVSWSFLLILFFLSGSALSRLPRPLALHVAEKSGRRDLWQVLANGGIPALAAVLHLLHPAPTWAAAFSGALAAAAADTWATEIGSRVPSTTVLITTLQPVKPGTSGGVSTAGTVAGMVASTLVGLAAMPVLARPDWALAVIAAGFTGSFLDSIAGAAVQEVRYCPTCREPTEQMIHHTCGTPTFHHRGVPGIDNDVVNVIATLSGALLAITLTSL